MERRDRHVCRAGSEKLCLTRADVVKFKMTFGLVFDFARAIEDCEHAKEGRSRSFGTECLKQLTLTTAHLTEPLSAPQPLV